MARGCQVQGQCNVEGQCEDWQVPLTEDGIQGTRNNWTEDEDTNDQSLMLTLGRRHLSYQW